MGTDLDSFTNGNPSAVGEAVASILNNLPPDLIAAAMAGAQQPPPAADLADRLAAVEAITDQLKPFLGLLPVLAAFVQQPAIARLVQAQKGQ